ncbi:MAG: hypothetical protein ACOCZ9_02230 [Spirochaetota bacterium]
MNEQTTRYHRIRLGRVLAALAVPVFLAGCGYVFDANLQGTVVDADNDEGINGAEVRVFHEKPNSADSDDFIVRTVSRAAGGTDGVFDAGVVWHENFAAFGDYGTEAGGTTLWLGVTYDRRDDDETGYQGDIVKAPGVLSDENNIVGDIALTPTVVSGDITGDVVDEDGDDVAGAFVDITVAETRDESGNYTGSADDVDTPDDVTTLGDGSYTFTAEWPKDSDIDEVKLELKFYPDADAADADEDRSDPDDTKTARAEQDEESTVAEATVDPAGADPAAAVQGQVVQGTDDDPYPGAVVEFAVTGADGGNTDDVDVPSSVTSDFEGEYAATVEWTDRNIETVELELTFYEDQDATSGPDEGTRTVLVEEGQTRTVSDVNITN